LKLIQNKWWFLDGLPLVVIKKLKKMRKTLLLTLILSGLLFACQDNKKEVKETKTVKVEKVNNTEKIERILEEFKTLYSELLEFKDKSNFKKYGFSQGGSYHVWLSKVKNLKENPDSKLLIQKGIVAGYLEQLGLAYVGSKGKETEVTKSFNQLFLNVISSNPVKKVTTTSGNSNYDKLKSESEQFDKVKKFEILFDKSKICKFTIENSKNSSAKAIFKNLSEYSTTELAKLPLSKRQILRITVPTEISKEQLENTLKYIVSLKTKEDNDLDEIIIFAFDNKNDVDSFYTFGKLLWAPNGKLGNTTPNIAKNNIRDNYKFAIDIKGKVGNIKKKDIPSKRELEIYNEIMSEKYWGWQEEDYLPIVMKKFNIKTEKELRDIHLKVMAYKLF